LAQLRHSKNNVRPQSWLDEIQKRKEQGIRADAKEMEVSSLPATPMYNAAIVEDIVMPLHKQILERTIHAFENVRGALMLLKVWLRQRQLVHSAIGFDMHTMSLLLAYLVQSKRVSTTAAPEIIFQAFLTFVTTFDRANQVLDFTTTGFVPRSQLSPEESNYSSPNGFVLRHPISLQPSSNGNLTVLYNIFWRVHDSAVTFLNNEAAKALQELSGSHRPGAFDRLFLQKRGFEDSFDQFFILQVPSWLEVINKVEYSSVESEEGENADFLQQRRERLEHASLHWPVEAYFACEAYQLLRKALGDRITEMCVSVMPLSVGDADSSKNSSSKYPSFSSTQHSSYILIGVFLDKEKHFRKVERGPPAVPASEVSSRGESAAERAVREFKDFWGSKAQLRRFKDGSILESVVWEDTDFSPLSHDLIEDISRFILSRHLRAAIGDVTSAFEDNDDLLTSGHFWAKMGNLSTSELLVTPQPATSSSSMANNHPSFKPELKIVAAFDELRGVLVNKLQRVPLRIDSLLAYSPELRYSSMYPAEPHLYVQLKYLFTLDQEADYKPLIRQYVGCPFSLVTTPIPVIAKFEASSRWPTDAAAIQKCKSAFMLKIKEEIWNQSQVLSIIHEDSLDILIQGFIFRVYPMATFETERIALMNTAPTNLFLSDLTPSHYAVNCRYVIPPLHHSAMKSLHAQFPIFGETVKLMRLWLARHQFSGHLSQEAIECLVAMEFLHPSTTCAPTTTSAAFLRTLQLLADFNWDEEPLVVDYSLIAGVSQDETEKERAKQAAKDASNPIAAAANLNVPMTTDIRTLIATRFRSSKTAMENLPVLEINPQQLIHPAMYIVTSADKVNEFEPMLKQSSPEKVVLNLMIQMAKLTISNIHSEYMVPSGIRIPQANDDDDGDNEVAEEESETQSVEHLGHFFQASSAVLKKCNVVLTFSEHLLAPERSIMVGGRRVVRNERDADSLQSGETGDEDDHSESDEIVGGVELTYRDVQAGPAFASTMLFANTGKNELDLSRLVVM
jgi:U3 small nucleolar RNA-associated protein 22